MQFKQLELKPRGGRVKRTLSSLHFRRSMIAIGVGSVIGFSLYYFTEGRLLVDMPAADILKSLLIGGFFGLFYTNSPCARGRC